MGKLCIARKRLLHDMQAAAQGFKEVKGNKALSRKSAHKKADPLKNQLCYVW